MAPDQTPTEERISDSARNGSITALGVLLGFSMTTLAGWSNRPGEWKWFSSIPLVIFGIGIALQIRALVTGLQFPPQTVMAHQRTIKLAVTGLGVMLLAFVVTIVNDVLCGTGVICTVNP